MADSQTRLIDRVYQSIEQLIQQGRHVEAIRYCHEVALTPLLESKLIVEAIRIQQDSPRFRQSIVDFFDRLERADLVAAAATLRVDNPSMSASEALRTTVGVARRLQVDLGANPLPSEEAEQAETNELEQKVDSCAVQLAADRAITNMMKRTGATREVATEVFHQLMKVTRTNVNNSASDSQSDQSSKSQDPLSRSSQANAQAIPSPSFTTLRSRNTKLKYFNRVRRLAAIICGLFALIALCSLCYSWFQAPKMFAALSMAEGLPDQQQSTLMHDWTEQNIPPTLTWFFSANRFISFRLEPGLPSDYVYLNLPWDQKLLNLNQSAQAMLTAFRNCHQVLGLFSLMVMALATWAYLQPSLVAGGLLTLLGLLGVPYLTAGLLQLELENKALWFGPLLLPGIAVLVSACGEMFLGYDQSPRSSDWQGFWLGTFAFVATTILLIWAIAGQSHLRANAGVGVLCGLLMMIHHGRRLLASPSCQ